MTKPLFPSLLLTLLVALLLGALALGLWARSELMAADARLRAASSQVLASPFGALEFVQGGSRDAAAPVVLVVHGSGGGFDQGALLAEAALPPTVRWIAPSRFGYLGSDLPEPAGFAQQAEAFAWLLDALRLPRVAVLALSQGGPSALWLAARHPERVASLTLLSAGVTRVAGMADQAQANRQGDALAWLFQADWRFWVVSRFARGPLRQALGASDALWAGFSPAQRALADAVIDGMHPASKRAQGVRLDHRAELPTPALLATIRVPTLVLHARDDTLQVFANAQAAARHIPGAELLAFEHGGHLLLVQEQGQLRERLAAWLR